MAIDVDYRETQTIAAAIFFEEWTDSKAVDELTVKIGAVADYVPGQFYQRELPCIQALLAKQRHHPSTIIVDGYVYLGETQKSGLGKHLWDALDGKITVIGVAKKRFHGSPIETELMRGKSKKPLYITAEGIQLVQAKAQIESMHGANRIPTLLKQVDSLCRES
ncbi:MAG: endonuclease V [Chloroflexota bacterium]